MVMDFGIARSADVAMREMAGTPAYMAPELWRGELPQPAADIYALGCVLYEMLCGAPPFQCHDKDRLRARQGIALMHQTSEPNWRALQSAGLPDGLLALLQLMLAKIPAKRPRAAQVESILRRLKADLPPDWRPQVQVIAEQETIAPPSVVDDTVVRPENKDGDLTRLHGVSPAPAQPAPVSTPGSTPASSPTLEHIPTGAQVLVQRQVAQIDLRAEACRAAIVHDAHFYTGTLAGQIASLDLETGHFNLWSLLSRSQVASSVWQFAAWRQHLIFHTGGSDWFELDPRLGALVRSGKLPEPGAMMAVSGDWLYML